MGEADYGLHVWPCAEVLASFIAMNRERFCGKKILEIGCGTGFVGIAASKLCKDVQLTLSDRSTDQRLLDLIKRNCELNGVPAERIRIIGLTWGDLEPILDRLRDLDVILASDCFYDPSVFEDVIVTMHALLTRNPTTVIYFSYQNRCSSWSIEWLLAKYALVCDRLPFVSDEYPSVNIGVIRLENAR